MVDLMSIPNERNRHEKQRQVDAQALAITQEAYEFTRMQVADEIARFLQSKNPSSWGINVMQALKNVESDWYAARNNEVERAKVPLFWDLFVRGHAAAVRRYVILATTRMPRSNRTTRCWQTCVSNMYKWSGDEGESSGKRYRLTLFSIPHCHITTVASPLRTMDDLH